MLLGARSDVRTEDARHTFKTILIALMLFVLSGANVLNFSSYTRSLQEEI